MKRIILAMAILLTLSISGFAQAVPPLMNFQGRLARPDGTPVADGAYSVRFALYDALNAGNLKWSETRNVTAHNGVFAILLGSVTPFTTPLFDTNLWLELKVGNDPALTPRQQIVSVGYAFKADQANTALGLTLPYEALVNTQFSALSITNSGGAALSGTNSSNVNGSNGVVGVSNAPNGNGVYGVASNGSAAYGVYGYSSSGYGVYGYGNSYGVFGSGNTDGVYGVGFNGVYGTSTQANGSGVYGMATQSNGSGVYGICGSGFGVYAATNGGTAIKASANTGTGGHFVSTFGKAVNASGGTYGGYFVGNDGVGVYGSGTSDGVSGATSGANKSGVYGYSSNAAGFGVYGSNVSASGYGLYSNGRAGGTQNWNAASDVRYKKNITTFPNALDTILNLRGVTFDWKQKDFPAMNFSDGRQIGFIAQEVEKILPELVTTDQHGYKSVAYANVVPVLVEAVKTLKKESDGKQTQIEALRAVSAELRAKNAELEARLNAIEAALRSAK